MPSGVRAPRSRLRALLVPVGAVPAEVIEVMETAAAISDVLGGHFLDDTTVGDLPGGGQVTFYRAEHSEALPGNPAAAALAARLGVVQRRARTRMRGPVLVVGLDRGRDVPVPDELIAEARRAGLVVGDGAMGAGRPLPRRHPGRHLDPRLPVGSARPVDPQILRRLLAALRGAADR